jgi:hypothetical protein
LSKRRNNSQRTGAPQPDAPTPPPPVIETPPTDIFSFISPTEFVELPSKGLLYAADHPLYESDVIEIRHMTAKEEDILTSESLIKQGVALDRLIDSLIVDKNITASNLLVGDKNAVLVAVRVTGFGPEYKVGITCPVCADENSVECDLSSLPHKEIDLDHNNAVQLPSGNYEMTFPHYKGLVIEVKLLNGADEKRIVKQRDKKKKTKGPDSLITDQLTAIIVRINEYTDAPSLQRFITECPTKITREIRAIYDAITPDIDMTLEFECSECEYEGKVGLPLTAEFFWPRS